MLHGPDEVDLVNSGLEETMINATHEIIECWKANPSIEDMRTASFVVTKKWARAMPNQLRDERETCRKYIIIQCGLIFP